MTGVQVYTFIFLQLDKIFRIVMKILVIVIGRMRWQRGRERVEAKCWIQTF